MLALKNQVKWRTVVATIDLTQTTVKRFLIRTTVWVNARAADPIDLTARAPGAAVLLDHALVSGFRCTLPQKQG